VIWGRVVQRTSAIRFGNVGSVRRPDSAVDRRGSPLTNFGFFVEIVGHLLAPAWLGFDVRLCGAGGGRTDRVRDLMQQASRSDKDTGGLRFGRGPQADTRCPLFHWSMWTTRQGVDGGGRATSGWSPLNEFWFGLAYCCMQLPPHLRRSLQKAYLTDFGRCLSDVDAAALGLGLLEVVGSAVRRRVCDVHRSSGASVDDSTNKREPEESI
jgi:hypothetical protein